jgi:hypothetical protein
MSVLFPLPLSIKRKGRKDERRKTKDEGLAFVFRLLSTMVLLIEKSFMHTLHAG